jgi:catechol 2,3-dioxygenase-like lactoylglutathione lyase family enzyme
MGKYLGQMALLVRDYDEAIQFFVEKLHFHLIEDTVLSEVKRWVVISPNLDKGCQILLAKAKNKEEEATVGNQTGGRVFLFLYTNQFEEDYQNLLRHQIEIVRGPLVEEYGKVLVFKDLYGNLWDLIAKDASFE